MAVVISNTVVNGVTLSADYGDTNPVTVTATGKIIDTGDYQVALMGLPTNPWTITNQGTIAATGTNSHGIYIRSGGTVTNSGLIDATSIGVYYADIISNSGTIVGDAFGVGGGGADGTLTNTGTILGGSGMRTGMTRVTNAGTIIGTAGYGVRLFGTASALVTNTGTIAGLSLSAISFDTFNPGGTVVNGSSLTTDGLISGASDGIFFSTAGTVINFGTIASGGGSAIFISTSGLVLNGNATATGRLIDGAYYGVRIFGGGTVSNFGTITAQNAVDMFNGGDVFNGSSGTPGALIHGTNDGVLRATNIINYGTIIGEASFGVDGGEGGTIINPDVGLITGANGIRTGATLVSNAGTIVGTSGYGLRVFAADGLVLNTALISGDSLTGVSFDIDGTLVNGTSLSTTGLVSGGSQGVFVGGAGTVLNFGSIASTLAYGNGIFIGTGGIVLNGSETATDRSITGGSYGVRIFGGGTVGNFGTVAATNAVDLNSGGDLFNGSAASPGALIHGTNDGVAGATNVINYGTIIGDASFAVDGGAGGTILNPDIGLITGANGIRTGATLVSNAGTIVGTTGYGLRVFATDGLVLNTAVISGAAGNGVAFDLDGTVVNGTSLSIDGLISGGSQGVVIGGAGTVVNFGSIGATDNSAVFIGGGGIVLNGNETATDRSITGGFYGVRIDGGAGTVSNFGTIAGTNAVYLSGGDVFNGSAASPGALIHGSNDGVVGATNIINYGTIIGEASFAIDGGEGGTITNPDVGLIAGANGIRTGATLVSNAGTVLGTTGYGVRVFATDGLVLNTALISGAAGNGVSFDSDGTVINGTSVATGIIAGGSQGVAIGGAGTVVNFGSIGATDNSAVFIGGGGVVLNGNAVSTGRLITGGFYGVRISGGDGTVNNFGTISGTNAVSLAGGLLLNGSVASPGALIDGSNDGVAGATDIVNFGTIMGAASFGIDGGAGGSISNADVGLVAGGSGIRTGATAVSNAGTIVGTTGYGLRMFATDGLVLNTDLIAGVGGPGASFDANGTVVNGSSLSTAGLIQGNEGVRIGGTGTLINFGSVAGVSAGVFLGAGIIENGSDTATGRSITGGYYGINIATPGTVRNFGTIAATNTAGASTGLRMFGGDVFNGSSIVTDALIRGNNLGIAGATNIANYGTIAGDVSFAIDGGGGSGAGAITNSNVGLIAGANGIRTAVALLSNAGTIVGTTGYGIHLFAPDSLVINTGLIAGATQGIGIYDTGTVTNFGTINGGGGTAILFSVGDDRLVVGPGGVFGGNVNGNAGSDVLELADGTGAGTLTGLGAKYLNFESLVFDPGAAWRVTLDAPAAFTGTVFGFSTDDSLALTGISFDPNATATLLANNVLQISANGSNFTMQFDPAQSFAGQQFRLSQDSTGGTRITLTLGPRPERDFNADGRSDILWHHSSGLAFIWEMDGFNPIETGLAGIVDPTWQISDTGDFGGDGRADILFRVPDGTVVISEMDGLTPINTGVVGFLDPSWNIVAAADFGGDGKDEILWRHDNGDVLITEMDGLTPVNSAVIGSVDPAWHIDGTGDFGGDGRADILWRHDNGDVVIWEMDGLTPINTGLVGNVDPSWQIEDTGDFGGDGRADILWRHDGGTFVIWEMNGLTPINTGVVGFLDNDWRFRVTGDYNGDGRSDILLHHTSGLVLEVQMDGTTPVNSGFVVDPGWQIVPSDNTGATQNAAAAGRSFGFADISSDTTAAQASAEAARAGGFNRGGEAVPSWTHSVAPLYDPPHQGSLYA